MCWGGREEIGQELVLAPHAVNPNLIPSTTYGTQAPPGVIDP